MSVNARQRENETDALPGEVADDEALADARAKLAAARRAFSAAQGSLPDLGAALSAGRSLSQSQLVELSGVAAALAEAARALGVDPEGATLPGLEARLAACEEAAALRRSLARLAGARGPSTAGAELQAISAEAARLAAASSWSAEDRAWASTLARIVELADAARDGGDDEAILALDTELRTALRPAAAAVVLAAERGRLLPADGVGAAMTIAPPVPPQPRAAGVPAEGPSAAVEGASAPPPPPAVEAESAPPELAVQVTGLTKRFGDPTALTKPHLAPSAAGAHDPVVAVTSLTKRYGELVAVRDVTFSVGPGTITGFLGPNGAGKTTTLRILLGLAEPTAGEALVFGHRYGELEEPARRVGAVLESNDFHPGRSGRNHLRALALAAEIPASRVEEVLALVGLEAAARRRVKTYSLGMRQRLRLAAALLGDPELLVLDEPANGLDPAGVRWLRTFLRQLAEQGRTVLVASHMLAEAALTVDQVVIIDQGRLVASGQLDEFTERGRTLEDAYLELIGGAS